MDFINAHYKDIAAIYASIVTIVSIIVKLIPTLPANSPYLPLVKWVAKFVALNEPTPTKADRAANK